MKRSCLLICAGIAISIFAVAAAGIYFNHGQGVNLTDQAEVATSIEAHTGHQGIEIKCRKDCGDFSAVLYSELSGKLGVAIFKRTARLWMSQYVFFGAASSSKDIDTYNFLDRAKGYALVVVYGESGKWDERYYCFVNSGISYKRPLSAPSVLDVYILVGAVEASAPLTFCGAW